MFRARSPLGVTFGSVVACVITVAAVAGVAAVAAAREPAAADSPGDAPDLKKDLAKFQEQLPRLSPEDAAKGWLALLDRQAAESAAPEAAGAGNVVEVMEDGDDSDQPDEPLDHVLATLPPPAAWRALAAAIDARPQPAAGEEGAVRAISLRLLAHTLTADHSAQQKDLAALRKMSESEQGPAGQNLAQLVQRLEVALEASADPNRAAADTPADRAVKAVEAGLAVAENTSEHSRVQTLKLPDLVAVLGDERARTLLRRVVVAPVDAEVPAGEKTLALARKAALELVEQMQAPQWRLVGTDAPSLALYEALEKKFPPDLPRRGGLGAAVLRRLVGAGNPPPPGPPRFFDHWQRGQARDSYVFGLMAAGRAEDATRVLREAQSTHGLPFTSFSHGFDASDRILQGAAVHDVMTRMLKDDPDLPLWDAYRSMSSRLGRTNQMLDIARAAAARAGLPEARRVAIRLELYQALLAADRVDEAAALLRELVKSAPVRSEGDGPSDSRGDLALKLARLGQALERPEWVDEGLDAARLALGELQKLGLGGDADHVASDYEGHELAKELAGLLSELGRGADAANLLADALARHDQEKQQQAERDRAAGDTTPPDPDDYEARELLVELLGVYHRTGPHADILKLFDEIPSWGAKDLAEILEETDSAQNSIGFIAASALAATGKTEQARRVLDAVLDKEPGFDPAYELLIKLDSSAAAGAGGAERAVKSLDALFARDRLEERPLIWKAQVLLSQKRLDEAEKTVRQAIAIDPSDGEQGPDRRMKAYAVLADVLEARGDKKQADFFREVVTAIRTAEKADALYEVGLLSRGIAMYEEALKHFQDAYCIQSRLAVQLAEFGQAERAAEHYQRAYELMPASFGRVESHCFGCEGVFRGATAQNIAERVFARLAAAEPLKPQVHYLLGYLRQQQGRPAEALASFQAAVKLDADYLNAWERIAGLADSLYLPAAQRDAAVLNLLRLDPLRRHATPDLSRVRDLPALWAAVEAAHRVRPRQPESLYPLAASAAEIKKARAAEADPQPGDQARYVRSHVRISSTDDNALPTPARAVAGTEGVRLIRELLGGGNVESDE